MFFVAWYDHHQILKTLEQPQLTEVAFSETDFACPSRLTDRVFWPWSNDANEENIQNGSALGMKRVGATNQKLVGCKRGKSSDGCALGRKSVA